MTPTWARAFYDSPAWQTCRRSYKKSVGGLCEDCLEQGLISPADEVHHMVRLTPDNIKDPSVTLAWSNLRALCGRHHKERHRSRRYTIDATGRLIV